MKDVDAYKGIIDLPHYQSKTRPRMSNHDRAAQFMPFAALKGYDDEITEEARLTDERIELGESEIDELNEKLKILRERIQDRPRVKVIYFKPDERKSGGAYISFVGDLRRIIENERNLAFTDGTTIGMNDLLSIEEVENE